MPTYTRSQLRRFDALTSKLSSLNNLTRIKARIDLKAFIADVGMDTCNAMFEVLKKRDARKAL